MWDSYRVTETGVCMFCIVWLTLDPNRHNQHAEEMKWNKTSNCLHQVISIIIRCIFSFLFVDRELTTWSANNCLLISVLLQVIFCSCIIETTLLCENGRSDQAERWSNDKTIIELGYCKASWFVSVSQINYLPQPSASANNWSARHWQITIFC